MSKRKYWFFGVAFALSLLADQASKIWARASLKPLGRPIVIVANYFDFRYSENPGSAFGLLRDFEYGRYLLLVFGVIALGVILWFLYQLKHERLRLSLELGLLAGGAVGNIVDRVLFGRVTDFIVWKVGAHEWPTFNIADAALVVGVIALLIDGRGEETHPSAASDTAGKP